MSGSHCRLCRQATQQQPETHTPSFTTAEFTFQKLTPNPMFEFSLSYLTQNNLTQCTFFQYVSSIREALLYLECRWAYEYQLDAYRPMNSIWSLGANVLTACHSFPNNTTARYIMRPAVSAHQSLVDVLHFSSPGWKLCPNRGTSHLSKRRGRWQPRCMPSTLWCCKCWSCGMPPSGKYTFLLLMVSGKTLQTDFLLTLQSSMYALKNKQMLFLYEFS